MMPLFDKNMDFYFLKLCDYTILYFLQLQVSCYTSVFVIFTFDAPYDATFGKSTLHMAGNIMHYVKTTI